MSVRPIVLHPAPILSTRADEIPVGKLGRTEVSEIARDLIDTMVAIRNAAGLAAPQIDVGVRMVAVKTGFQIGVYVNPEIINRSEVETSAPEECLSLPDVRVDVSRARLIDVAYVDLFGDRREFRAADLTARILQHEIDHLDGITILDRRSVVVEKSRQIGRPQLGVDVEMSRSLPEPYIGDPGDEHQEGS